MEVVFVRHGQTDLNKTNRIQGASVDYSLNKAGRAYVERVAAKFNPQPFAAVYASPLKRAKETASILVKGQKTLHFDRRLIEFDYGEWDGHSLAEVKNNHPDAIDPWGKVAGNYVNYAPHGETYAHLEKRCAAFLNDLQTKYPSQEVLVVSHGTTIRMLLAHVFTHGQLGSWQTMANCGLAKISYRQGQARLLYYNRLLV